MSEVGATRTRHAPERGRHGGRRRSQKNLLTTTTIQGAATRSLGDAVMKGAQAGEPPHATYPGATTSFGAGAATSSATGAAASSGGDPEPAGPKSRVAKNTCPTPSTKAARGFVFFSDRIRAATGDALTIAFTPAVHAAIAPELEKVRARQLARQ